MDAALERRLSALLDRDVVRLSPLTGGCIAAVYRVDLMGGDTLVAKLSRTGTGLAIEGWMLDYLLRHSDLPVPEVRYCDDGLLVMDPSRCRRAARRGGGSRRRRAPGETARRQCAHLRAGTRHGDRRPARNRMHRRPTGSRSSPNSAAAPHGRSCASARPSAAESACAPRMAGGAAGAVDRCADATIVDPWRYVGRQRAVPGRQRAATASRASSIWRSTLPMRRSSSRSPRCSTPSATRSSPATARGGRYDQAWFEERRDLYNLYPLLVHVRLFGGGYVGAVGRILDRFGA